jgi:hypothetical protein
MNYNRSYFEKITSVDVLNYIYNLLDISSKKVLLNVSHYFRELCIKRRTSLVLIPVYRIIEELKNGSQWKKNILGYLPINIINNISANLSFKEEYISPNDILIKIINTFINIKKLSIFYLSTEDIVLINELINYLNNIKPLFYFGIHGLIINFMRQSFVKMHPLRHVKKLVFEELQYNYDYDYDNNKPTQKLNKRLLKALIHKDLESITIRIYRMPLDTTSNEDIQFVLDNCPKLKKFNLCAYFIINSIHNPKINISFTKSINLVSVKLQGCHVDISTIQTLKELKLQTLKVDGSEIDNLLHYTDDTKLHTWNGLKRLESISPIVTADQLLTFSKNFPNLEALRLSILCVDKLDILGQYCPNIKILLFGYNYGLLHFKYAPNDIINSLTSTLPNLKALMFTSSISITDMGIKYIVNNCPNLQVLNIFPVHSITKKSLILIVEKYKQLKVLGIQFMKIKMKDIEYLINNLKELVWLNCYFEDHTHKDNMEILKSKYPYMIFNNEDIEDISTIKKYIT